MKIRLANIGLWILTICYIPLFCISACMVYIIFIPIGVAGYANEYLFKIYHKHPMWYSNKIKKILNEYRP